VKPKPPGYYAQTRSELVALLPRPLGRVLDVGCAEGGAAAPLREAGAEELVGVEIHAPSAERARAAYDEVHTGPAQDVVPALQGPFDTILLYDTLEHIAEPEGLLRALAAVAGPRGRIHVSVPNARHWTLLRDLALRGTFGYAEVGHRDSTHLRWFTRADLAAVLERSGWRVESVTHGPLRPVSRLAARLTRGLSPEFLVYQWAALGVREVGG
jgi:2-polyprenyl-3-methyl-5-hydroxy-6-metoxy-1,4-benzoquinol methylase